MWNFSVISEDVRRDTISPYLVPFFLSLTVHFFSNVVAKGRTFSWNLPTRNMMLQVNLLAGKETIPAFHTQLASRFNCTRGYRVVSSIRNSHHFQLTFYLSHFFCTAFGLPLQRSVLEEETTAFFAGLFSENSFISQAFHLPYLLSNPDRFVPNAWRQPNPRICYCHGPATDTYIV